MKLYDEFKNIVTSTKHGKLVAAWFTSFEISTAFIEKYLLPLFTRNPDMIPVSRQDYEIIQREIAEAGIDLAFFGDASFVMREAKKTTIPIYGININKLGDNFSYGFFHPKVGLLRFENESHLITGSANLTLSGWSRNIECIAIKKIELRENAEKVAVFFNRIVSSLPGRSFRVKCKELTDWVESFKKGTGSWSFHSSFNKEGFLSTFTGNSRPEQLYVWSPYFAANLPSFLDKDLKPLLRKGAAIHIIPDRFGEEERVRIAAPYQKELKGKVRFFKDRYFNDDFSLLVHAKVWLTEKKCACGSWNMTEAGTNTAPKGHNNIEAGIIEDIDKGVFKALTSRLISLDDITYLSTEEIENEIPARCGRMVNCMVTADWLSMEYCINLEDKEQLEISLPGIKRVKIKGGEPASLSFKNHYQELLKDHIYNLYERGADSAFFTGMVIEKNVLDRPVDKFSSFTSLLYGLVQGEPEKAQEAHVLAYSHRRNEENGLDDEEDPVESLPHEKEEDELPSWYVLFKASNFLARRLKETKDKALHRKIVRTYPGSVLEWSEKAMEVIAEGKGTPVYRWFLCQEALSLIRISKEKTLFMETVEALLKALKNIKIDDSAKGWAREVALKCGYLANK